MSQVFDKEISQFEEELTTIINNMEQTRRAFLAATVVCLRQWFQKQTRTYVQERYELTNQMGLPKLTEMKLKVAALVVAAPTTAKQCLGNRDLWWHLSRGGGWKDHHASEPPEALEKAVQALVGQLFPILESYGYIKLEPDVEDLAEGKEEDKPRKPLNRPFTMEWSEEMTTHIAKYTEDLGRAQFLDSKKRTAETLKQKYQAAVLWDKA